MLNALTVDVEDYYHVSAFEPYLSDREWDYLPSRIESNTMRVLEILDIYGVKATFFVLGWIAEVARRAEQVRLAGIERRTGRGRRG